MRGQQPVQQQVAERDEELEAVGEEDLGEEAGGALRVADGAADEGGVGGFAEGGGAEEGGEGGGEGAGVVDVEGCGEEGEAGEDGGGDAGGGGKVSGWCGEEGGGEGGTYRERETIQVCRLAAWNQRTGLSLPHTSFVVFGLWTSVSSVRSGLGRASFPCSGSLRNSAMASPVVTMVGELCLLAVQVTMTLSIEVQMQTRIKTTTL